MRLAAAKFPTSIHYDTTVASAAHDFRACYHDGNRAQKVRPLRNSRYTIGLAAAVVVLLAAIFHRLLETPLWSYNGARLMPSFAVAHGVNYYVVFPPGGPLYSSLYGPITAIVYLPATLFPSPNSAVLAASFITILLCFSAAAALHFLPLRTPPNSTDVLAFLALAFLMCYLEPLKYSCFNIHSDGPGLALGAFACAALYPGRRSKSALPIAALCSVLAVFCKQPYIGIPIALAIYIWVSAGRATALRYLLWTSLAAAVCAAVAISFAGLQPLYHCLLWLPSRHPWNSPSHLTSAVQAFRAFIRLSLPVLLLLTASAILLYSARLPIHALAQYRAAPLLFAGIVLLPFSIAARAKAGGDTNSLSFALFFLTAGLTVMLADIARFRENDLPRRLAIATLAAIVLPLAISEAPLALDAPASVSRLAEAPQQVAFTYLQHHPGAAYFPWFPQSHYYAEHQFRHYAYGLIDRSLAHDLPSDSEFRKYIPPYPHYIAFAGDGTPSAYGFDIMRYLPGYTNLAHDPELPGWLIYSNR